MNAEDAEICRPLVEKIRFGRLTNTERTALEKRLKKLKLYLKEARRLRYKLNSVATATPGRRLRLKEIEQRLIPELAAIS